MSLFSKFTSKFAHSLQQRRAMAEKLTEVLGLALLDTQNFDLKESTELLSQFLIQNPEEHIYILFHFIETSTSDFEPLKIIQLLAIIHELLKIEAINQNIAIEIKSTKILWIQNIGDSRQNVQSKREHCQNFGDELDMELKTKNLIFQYAQQCYFYIQRISLNVDLYSAILKNKYPYTTNSDDLEVRLMFTWCYKIQNIMNYATQLLEYNADLLNIQYLIYKDLMIFQSFICQEINKVFDSYATIPTNDTISLYEIYNESEKHYQSLLKFHQKTTLTTQAPTHCELQNLFLQEFLAFVTKVRVLNKLSFKKSIHVPNEKNPCLGMQTKDTNIIHLKMGSNLLKMEQIVGEDEETDEDNTKNNNNQKSRRLTNRGQTTFYHQ